MGFGLSKFIYKFNFQRFVHKLSEDDRSSYTIRNCYWAIVKMQILESLLRLVLNDNVSSIKQLVIIFKYQIQTEIHIADETCFTNLQVLSFSSNYWQSGIKRNHTCRASLNAIGSSKLNSISGHCEHLLWGNGKLWCSSSEVREILKHIL